MIAKGLIDKSAESGCFRIAKIKGFWSVSQHPCR